MSDKVYPDHYTAADIIADVIWADEGTLRGTVTEAAQALKDSGRLMPAPTIIRTVEELQALDPDTPLWSKNAGYLSAAEFLNAIKYDIDYADDLPAVVLATADQVRAAQKALEEA